MCTMRMFGSSLSRGVLLPIAVLFMLALGGCVAYPAYGPGYYGGYYYGSGYYGPGYYGPGYYGNRYDRSRYYTPGYNEYGYRSSPESRSAGGGG